MPFYPDSPAELADYDLRLSQTHIWAAAESTTLWLANSVAGLFTIDENSWHQLYQGPAGPILGPDSAGRLWVILDAGEEIAAFQGDAWLAYGQEAGWTKPDAAYLSPGYGDTLVTDENGGVWLVTGSDDLRRFDPDDQRWTIFTAEDIGFSPPGERDYQGHFLTDVIQDVEGNLLVSDCIGQGEVIRGQGIRRFDGAVWHPVPETAGKCIMDMAVGPSGQLWAGGLDAIFRIDPGSGQWQEINIPQDITDRGWGERPGRVVALNLDAAGVPWIVVTFFTPVSPIGPSALYRWTGESFEAPFVDYEDLMLFSLDVAPDGATWILMQTDAGGRLYRPESGFTQDLLVPAGKLQVDGAGRIWLANPFGGDVWRYEPAALN